MRWLWLVGGLLAAIVLWYITYAGSAGFSCGAYDSGPNPGAEAAFCGDPGSGYAVQFHLVQMIPALSVLAGAVGAYRRSGWHLPVGVLGGLVLTALIWWLEP